MANLRDRDKHESLAIKKIAKLSRKHLSELKDLVGWPIDPTKIPAEFWRRIESEMSEELAVILILLWMASAMEQGMDGEFANLQGPQWANRRALFTGRSYAKTSRHRFGTLAQDAADGKLKTPADFQERMESIFGDSRSEMIGKTETTSAITGATRSLRDQYNTSSEIQGNWKLVWRLGPCRHCLVCPLLADTDESVWGYFSDGPPAHQNCCCFCDVVPASLILPTPPSYQEIAAAAIKTGIFRRGAA